MTAAADEVPEPARLHVLLAMCYLVHRTGAELFTRDLALWLRRRGHSVTVFATAFGEMADELRYESIACITEPALLTRRPDVIVGNTHHETVRAVLQFPDVPAISICHDRSHEHGYPPRLRQIRRFVAVDENCAERLLHEHGLAEQAVRVIPNGVDLQRFRPRAELPAQPRRALVFSNYTEDDALLEELRAACSGAGLQLDAFGARLGNLQTEPGDLLGGYDLVFAKGRAAMEALAVGCACVLLDHSFKAMGTLVTRAEVEQARRWNFGRALLTQPITAAALQAQIARYDAADAAAVRDWVRSHAGIDVTCAALEALARDVVGEQRLLEVTPAQQVAGLREYLDDWVRAHHPTCEHALIAELREHAAHLEAQRNQTRQDLAAEQIRAQRATDDSGEKLRLLEAQALAREQQLLEQLQSAEQSRRELAREQNEQLIRSQRAADGSGEKLRLLEAQALAREQQFLEQLQSTEQSRRELAREQNEQLLRSESQAAARAQELRLRLQQAEQSQREQAQALGQKLQHTESAHAVDALADAGRLRASEQRTVALQNRVQALLDSASWRITAPLRRIYSLIVRR